MRVVAKVCKQKNNETLGVFQKMESLPKLSVLTKLVPHLTASMTKEDFSGARLLTSCRHYGKADLVGRSNTLDSVLALSFNF